ncbi:uncharacterized protein LOC124924064 [Impatiens glandulifera]|uniref:uncharacterized protein LOC124924064 n=1 Tax=Impatiens glandulifera TaxID=253017 RepID=UPI001FB197BC|nr:uncharacterized protein LOC124924064 [Impatiens glandulifera]XP_047320068.1 uncharacterized protein LOC124924064 [Impatiens glandulifera]
MEKAAVVLVMFFLIASQVPSGMMHPDTFPAFLWSSHQDSIVKEAVNYQTLSLKDLVKSVLFEGEWSNFLCSHMERQQPMDVALLIVGRELKSLDISRPTLGGAAQVDFLKDSFMSANFSIAFPYVSASNEEFAMEKSLVSEIAESCGSPSEPNKVVFLDSCSLEGENFEKLVSFDDYLVSRKEKKQNEQADLVVACQGASDSDLYHDHSQQGQMLTGLLNSVKLSGARYTVLYVSDPSRPVPRPLPSLGRFLAERTGNLSDKSEVFCDEVCQIKSSLLSGLLVAIVLIIILISGLCCLMGIDTPTRFEAPQES